jgi:hypothetical protein
VKTLKEEDVVRIRDLEEMKLPPPPAEASACRGYKNTVLTTIGGFQKTDGNELYQWIMRCTTAKSEKELESSEGFPITDRKLGVKLQSSAKGGKFGLLFQSMIEENRRKYQRMPSGRQMLWRVLNEFDLERQRGGLINQKQLLEIRLAGNTVGDLDVFKDKIVFIRSAMEDVDLPNDSTLTSFLYEQIKYHPKLATTIEKYESSKLGSHRRTYEWLWERMLGVIARHQADLNAQSVDKALLGSRKC